jgi:asparagine N-glycosylation enzyme membrane subunit Stt3
VALGLAAVLVQLLFAARWLGASGGLVAGLLAALLPIQIQYGALGFVDQHVAEQLGFCLAVLGVARCATAGGRGPALVALAIAVGPWLWQGSILTAAFVVLAGAAALVLRPDGSDAAVGLARRVAAGCGAGAGALALSMLAFGPSAELRSPGLNGLSWVHPTAAAAGALALLALAAFARARPGAAVAERAAATAAAGVAGAALVVASSPSAVGHGLRSLRAVDPWLRTITEFQPVLGSIGSFREDVAWVFWAVGPVLLAPVLGLGAFRRRWRAGGARTPLLILAAGTVTFVPLFLARSRFVVYAAPFLVWWGALVVSDAVERGRSRPPGARRWALAAVALVAFLVPSAHLSQTRYRSVVDEELVSLLAWIRGSGGSRGGVLAPWTLGHAIQYYAGAPVVVSPFGTDVGPGGMRRVAAFYYAPTGVLAEQVLRDADVRWVLFAYGLDAVSDAFPFAPAGAVPVVAEQRDYWGRGRSVLPLPSFEAGIFGRIYANDGAPRQVGGDDGIPFLRLVHETSDAHPYKLFERVEGARVAVRGAEPFEPVAVYVELVTNQRRRLSWSARATAGADGVASLRVPYATGRNGACTATMYVAAAGARRQRFTVGEDAVATGAAVEVPLGGAVAAR